MIIGEDTYIYIHIIYDDFTSSHRGKILMYNISEVKIELMLAFSVACDCGIQNRSDPLALVLPSWSVRLGDFAHEGAVHQVDLAFGLSISVPGVY